jgi:Protein of unknown function (DUF2393)
MQMSPLTPWHYLLLGGLTLFFILGIIVSLRTNSKYSVFTTITLTLILIGFFSWKTINESVYIVEVSNLEKERFYQSEQILIKGMVRNTGKFPVAHIVATVKLINSHGGVSGKDSIFTQPSVFAEIYEGDDPKFKKQSVVEEHEVAENLDPGSSKPFSIMMGYPSHFSNASFDVTAKAAY